jgi:two-component system chemotaxis response regulator CheB
LLNRQCQADVSLVKGPTRLMRGRILVGAGAPAHLVVKNTKTLEIALEGDAPVSGHLPSVDALFLSLQPIADRVSAAILTGMGRDGAQGMLKLRQSGARTFAQDEATSVVFGMPRAAIEEGAAEAILPIQKIGPALLQTAAQTQSKTRVTAR